MLKLRSTYKFLYAIVILMASCMSSSKFVSKGTYDTSKVPAGFNPKKHILLVAEMPRLNNPEETNPGVTRKLDKALKENYGYQYEIVPLKAILDNKDNKYADTSVYRYALLNNLSIITRTTTTTTRMGDYKWSVSPSARTTYIDFNFFDRANGTAYPASGNSSTRMGYATLAFVELIRRAKVNL